MEIIKPRTLSGFMELLPDKQIRFETMVDILRRTYASYGFAPWTPPPSRMPRFCLPRAAAKPKSRFTAFRKATATWRCGST